MIPATILGFALLLGLLLLGVPVAFSMLIAGVAGVWMSVGADPVAGVLAFSPYETVASYTLSTVPLFILMAEYLTAGRFTSDLFTIAYRWLGHLRGGVSYAAVGGGVLLAAISGSSTAAASTLASVAFPEMRRLNYDARFASALLAIVGTLAIMIPPSLGLILYGVFTETSVGRLLLAGFVPGLLTAVGYVVTIYALVRRNPGYAPRSAEPASWSLRLQSLGQAWPILALLVGMVTALYSGIITATEVGAVGALAALVIGVLMGRIDWRAFWTASTKAVHASAMILTIVGFSVAIGIFMSLTGTTQALLGAVAASGMPPQAVVGIVLAILLILGFFLDQLAILILTLPVVFPLLTGLGYDAVWLGIIFVKTAEIGLVTPPMGMNAFVVAGVTKTPVSQVFRGIWPFVVTEIVVLALLVSFPQLSLWVPALVYK
jgi:C4-dicarboxylate transporter, DctM subunit